jgi:hypothetical protein
MKGKSQVTRDVSLLHAVASVKPTASCIDAMKQNVMRCTYVSASFFLQKAPAA